MNIWQNAKCQRKMRGKHEKFNSKPFTIDKKFEFQQLGDCLRINKHNVCQLFHNILNFTAIMLGFSNCMLLFKRKHFQI